MGAILDLPAARKAINDTGQADEVELTGVLAAAEKLVLDRVGDITALQVVEDHRHVDGLLVLHRWPVLSVTSVTLLPAGTVVAPDDPVTGEAGYVLHDDGTLEHDFRGARVVRVAYTAGRTSVPDDVRHGTERLLAHLWRGSQHRIGGAGQRTVLGGGQLQDATVPSGFAWPHAVTELLDSETRPAVIG